MFQAILVACAVAAAQPCVMLIAAPVADAAGCRAALTETAALARAEFPALGQLHGFCRRFVPRAEA